VRNLGGATEAVITSAIVLSLATGRSLSSDATASRAAAASAAGSDVVRTTTNWPFHGFWRYGR
jgi:hypothetical protein